MRRLLNLGFILAFSLCFMEWGKGHTAFVAQAEYQLLFEKKDLSSFAHPIILAGLAGQLILLYAAIVAQPNKWVHLIGVIALGSVVSVILLAGLLSTNPKMIASALPFVLCSVVYFSRYRFK
ncbi:MAG: hypothetical protein U0X91_17955 [Spirosomataceae bacterium]